MPNIKGSFETGSVWINGTLLQPTKSLKVRNHSPTGFSWGYAGSGPAQLSLAILLEFFPEEIAVRNYQSFKFRVVAQLPQRDFSIDLSYYDMVDVGEVLSHNASESSSS